MNSINFINGNIITLDQEFPKAHSLSINNGRISLINDINKNFNTIDLKGATVIPGFIDSHFHLKNFGKRLNLLDLKNVKSLSEITNLIKTYSKNISFNDWILGFGWDQNLWEAKSFPFSNCLDDLNIKQPIYLTRIDGHAAWVNSVAIKKINKTVNQLNEIDGGQIINDCILIDNCMHPFKTFLPEESKDNVKDWILLAANKAVEMGITTVHDAWQDKTIIEAIKELIIEDKFPLRCYGMLASNDRDLLSDFFKNGHYKDEYLTIRSVKAFIDGALGSRGAALHEPYCDDSNNCGLILISKEEFSDLVKLCYMNNYQLNTHAIGDRGNTYVLDHYAQVLGKNNNRRWRIEHAQMVDDDDMRKFKEYSVLPSMQPSHCTSDMNWLPERIGKQRLKLISRWQSFIKLGLKIPGGSDCPIETGNPLFEFYAAITRQNHNSYPELGFQPQEKVYPKEALKMFTTWGAYGSFNENNQGQISLGYNGDLTVISEDILSVPAKNILDIEILYTIVNGKIVYQK